ncbi:hypothetical protein RSOLAG22IIIB_05247 [Rhizoctonia solani]|uniref:CsbD-like domain-containing protein n=1 Tax=Rhizoctonia solani TaxID=456999 RepID=A0A0K6G4H9_9AGAM|nr:hypothetical protein RSOLAG22IIIB_05247 [Rhizoctonia solani]
MSEPTVTSTSFTHSAPISKPHPHSVAYETVPPESRPAGSEENGTAGPSDTPPGMNEGEQYPPQIHAGKGLGAKVTGLKEQLKGKITGNHELEQKGKDRMAGKLAAKQQDEDDAKNPFQNKEEGAETLTDAKNKSPNAPATELQSAPTVTTESVPMRH